MSLQDNLDGRCKSMLAGIDGPAMQLAMQLVVRAGQIMGARQLIDVSFAHIDACFYNGQAHVDFARFMLGHGAKFAVPAWTNNGLVSLANPDIRPRNEDRETVDNARQLMKIYEAMGCRCIWTCAPYQLPGGPVAGDHIVVGESNAVAYYNGAVGARTNKYGDYLDVACALTGKAPLAGLHLDQNRHGEVLLDVRQVPDDVRRDDVFFHLLGHIAGRICGQRIPVVAGLAHQPCSDNLKAFSAAAAASGGVCHWHFAGITPEAKNFTEAIGEEFAGETHVLTRDDLAGAFRELSRGSDGRLAMVCLGTPHFSLAEFEQLAPLIAGRRVADGVVFYISTSRFVFDLAEAKGLTRLLEKAGAKIIVDTCTYFSPAVRGATGRAMTNAAKWAWYAPGMLGLEVCFGSLAECVESAVSGEVRRDPAIWYNR